MAYTKYAYTRVNWKNKSESLETPLGKTNLNRMDSAIYQIAENVDVVYNEMDAKKLDKSSVGKMLSATPTWDADTGILTFQFYDGTEFSVDFNIEKIPVSFSMDSSGLITMTTADGTQWTANIADMIPDYVFEDSDRIVFTKTKNKDGSYKITADIVKGSITGDYLEPNYLSNVTTQASKAEASANSAGTYADNASYDAKLAQSYAVGGSGIRDGEDADNAKKYAKDAKDSADRASEIVGGNFITQSEKGIAGGVASLDDNGKIPVSQIPDDISVNEMTGATETEDGKSGLVPAPKAGDKKKALLGDGTWGDVAIDVDDVLSDTSKNPVQNKVVTASISDTKNSKVTFTSNDTLAPTEFSEMPSVLASKETHASLFSKISTVFRNMRYIIGLLGSTDISKETLGIGDSTVTGAIKGLNESLGNVSHNVPRLVPKDITSYYNDGSLWDRLNGTNGYSLFEDIFVGDYIQMSRPISAYEQTQTYQKTGSQYVTIAGINTLLGNGDTAVNYNHLVMVPGQGFGGTQHFGRSRMNPTNTTVGGYVATEMHTTTIGAVATEGSTETTATINQQLYAEFGSHLKTTKELLSNAINSTGYNRFGSNTGCSNGWVWTDCQAVLMSEIEVYGSIVWSSSGYDTGSAKAQFPLFANNKYATSNRSAYYFFKDVASATYFCDCLGDGRAFYDGASNADVYVRPRFVIAK